MHLKRIKSNKVSMVFHSSSTSWLLVLFLSIGWFFASQAYATITSSGDVEPASGFSTSEDLYIGKTGSGSLTVESPAALESVFGRDIYLGYGPDAVGTANIIGSGASIQAFLGRDGGGNIYIGYEGTGQINISDDEVPFQSDGGARIVGRQVWIGAVPGGSGSVHFDGGTLLADTLYASSSSLMGTGGVISVGGLVSDIDLNFDATHGTTARVIPLTGAGQNLQVWLNLSEYQNLGVGYNGNATLTISEGVTVKNDTGYLGYTASSTGQAIISGGATWEQTDSLYVGYEGTGVLEITDNAQVIAPDSTYVGSVAGKTGTVQLGNGGTLTTGVLYTDFQNLTGNGVITTNGLVVDNDVVFDASYNPSQPILANGSGSNHVEINLIPTTYQNMIRDLGAGYQGNGSLTISGGITVEADRGIAGISYGSVGTINVTGSNSLLKSSLMLGLRGSGCLDIENGGTVEGFGGIFGVDTGSQGTVNVNGSGSTWSIQGGGIALGSKGDGYLNVTNGGVVTGTGINNLGGSFPGALGSGTALVSGENSVWSNETLIVGYEGAGLVDINEGGLVIVDDLLVVDLMENQDSFIDMKLGGMLAIAGEGSDSLDDFLALGQPDPAAPVGTGAIRCWDNVSEAWMLLADAELGTDYTLEYKTQGELSGYTVLTVGSMPVAGDANGDGKVDGSDVTILAGNWQYGVGDGQTATRSMGDFNGDGQVDGSDVTILAGNWQYGVTAATNAVPEPTGIILIFTLLIAGSLQSRILFCIGCHVHDR